MEWPPGPYEYAMFALLLMTIPVQRLLTRDEVHMRVPLRGLLNEIREKGYWWHIALYLLMFLYKAIIDHHNEPMKAELVVTLIGFTRLKATGLFGFRRLSTAIY